MSEKTDAEQCMRIASVAHAEAMSLCGSDEGRRALVLETLGLEDAPTSVDEAENEREYAFARLVGDEDPILGDDENDLLGGLGKAFNEAEDMFNDEPELDDLESIDDEVVESDDEVELDEVDEVVESDDEVELDEDDEVESDTDGEEELDESNEEDDEYEIDLEDIDGF